MLVQDKILNFLKVTGPTLPTKVAKNIGSEIFIASAHLSDLASQGKVKISKLKVGGSPLYYLQGQEDQLYDFAAGNVNPKNLVVANQLRDQKVMRESEMDLLAKVALRAMKDFAVPLTVNFQGNSELFWKWHLCSAEETNQVISTILRPPKEEEVAVESIVVPEEIPKPVKEETLAVEEQDVSTPEEPKKEPEKEPNKESNKESEVVNKEIIEKELDAEPEPTKDKEEGDVGKVSNVSEVLKEESPKKEQQKTLTDKPKIVRKKKASTFLPQIKDYFSSINVQIKEQEIVRKNAELNMYITVPSVIGKMTYFCKAKKKNKCDEKDISAAYMESQIKKLPLLFLYTGEIHKKAQEMLDSGAFENVILKKIE